MSFCFLCMTLRSFVKICWVSALGLVWFRLDVFGAWGLVAEGFEGVGSRVSGLGLRGVIYALGVRASWHGTRRIAIFAAFALNCVSQM